MNDQAAAPLEDFLWKHAKRWGLPAFDTVGRYWGSCAELHQTIMQRWRLKTILEAITPEKNGS